MRKEGKESEKQRNKERYTKKRKPEGKVRKREEGRKNGKNRK